MLLVATPREPPGSTFEQAVILIVDAEPNGIVTGICLNRPLDARVIDTSALALLFVTEPDARVFWGGPMGSDPAILAQLSGVDGLEWFHLPIEQRRPFPLPDVGVIAVAEHTGPFEDRITRARVFVGLCVWGRGQLEGELGRGDWVVHASAPEHIFSDTPGRLWASLTAQ
jgi:putative transcriptional regulator